MKKMTAYKIIFLCAVFSVCFFVLWPDRAQACCACGCNCGEIAAKHATTRSDVNNHTDDEFDKHEEWMVDTLWEDYMFPMLQMMTEELTAAQLMEMEIVGSFFDAENQLETQRLLQELQAEAHKDYIPSESVCKMGTLTRSVAQAQRRGQITQMAMTKGSIDRQLQTANMISVEETDSDRMSRFEKFKSVYCDHNDFNGAFEVFCDSVVADRVNKDIDYARTIGGELSLHVDFVDPNLEPIEEDVIALSRNLYAHNLFTKMTRDQIENKATNDEYLDLRSVIAKRSVAENSFNAIMGMKTAGPLVTDQPPSVNDDGTSPEYFTRQLLVEMGMPEDEVERFVGENPSYYAQMEVLTKKIYQDPAFITNLIDTPANVKRQFAAMQSFGLMQQRDIFDTLLRSEMLLSVLLELEIAQKQEDIQNEVNRLSNVGKRRQM